MNFPRLIFYTDSLPDGVGGDAHAFVVRIRPEYRGDDGIHEHELEHVRQWWRLALLVGIPLAIASSFVDPWLIPGALAIGLGLHPALYQFCRRYRQWAEVQAYRKQMQYPDRIGLLLPLPFAAYKLASDRYRLGISSAEAVLLLLGV